MARCLAQTNIQLAAILLAALVMSGPGARAGDLNPPAGAVTPTMKNLAQIEPRTPISSATTPGDADSVFKITASGSYYLLAPVSGVGSKHGIEIAASGVTVDLMGFEVLGTPGSLDGVTAAGASLTSISVRNGSIRSWSGEGLDLTNVTQAELLDLRVSSCSSHAMVAGANAVISRCAANGNGSAGILTGANALISDCSVGGSGLAGIDTLAGATITRCTVRNSGGHGINTGDYSSVTGCVSQGNSQTGITALAGVAMSDCTASSNTVGGINTGAGATLHNCSARSNIGYGINVLDASSLTGCSASANFANGISVVSGCLVAHCTSSTNSNHGIVAVDRCTITDCTVALNGNDGIRFNANCLVKSNNCPQDGNIQDAAGIHALGTDNVIDSNVCTLADRNIDVDTFGNVITRNSCSGAVVNNYDVAANNRFGTVVNLTAGGISAFVGNSAASSVTTTDPWANFAY